MPHRPQAPRANRVKDWLVWGMFAVFLVLPLYAVTAVVAFRSNLLSGDALTDEQYKAMWTFIASGLAAAATVLGALLTKAQNDRSNALQAQSEERQRLDSVVRGLGLMGHEGGYAPKAVIAGALSTLVELGYPPVATRALSAAMEDNQVDNATLVWLLDSMLSANDGTLNEEGASLLQEWSANLTSKTSNIWDWPNCVTAAWPRGLSKNASNNIIRGLVTMLTSQNPEWWEEGGGTWSWAGYTLDEAMQHDLNPTIRAIAAHVFIELAPFPEGWLEGFSDSREADTVLARAKAIRDASNGVAYVQSLNDMISAWRSGGPANSSEGPI